MPTPGTQTPDAPERGATEARGAPVARRTPTYGLTEQQSQQAVLTLDGGKRSLTLRAFAELLGPRPRQRGLPPEAERRSAFLARQLETELLSRQARLSGLMVEPELRGLADRALVRALVRDEQLAALAAEPIDDAYLARYYAEHPEYFDVPARARTYHILVGSVSEARTLLQQLGPAPGLEQFRALSRSKSKDSWSASRGGRLGDLVADPGAKRDALVDAVAMATWVQHVPDSLLEAVFKSDVSGLLPEPVASPLGVHVVFVERRTPASHLPLATARDSLQQKLTQERAEEALQRLVDELMRRAEVNVDEQALSALP